MSSKHGESWIVLLRLVVITTFSRLHSPILDSSTQARGKEPPFWGLEASGETGENLHEIPNLYSIHLRPPEEFCTFVFFRISVRPAQRSYIRIYGPML